MTETQIRNELVAKVVSHLPGATLNIDPDGYACRADYADGRQLWFRLDVYKRPNRLEVSGNWPQCRIAKDSHNGPMVTPRDILRGNEVDPSGSITVSAERTPEQIAKDITRRFLPGYTEMYVRCALRRNERDAEAVAKADLEKYLIELVGDERLNLPKSFTETRSCYGSVVVNSSNSIQIDLRGLDSKTAVEVLNFLKTL